MNIYEKILEVRKMVDFLQKNTQGYQYSYVSGTSVLGSIRPKMDELGLLLLTNIVEEKQDRYQWDGIDSKGKPAKIIQFVTTFKMKMTWINVEKPEEVLISDWFSSGEDEDPSKANGKAHTYGERYYLLKFFNVPTDKEDPDAFQKKQERLGNVTVGTNLTTSPKVESKPLMPPTDPNEDKITPEQGKALLELIGKKGWDKTDLLQYVMFQFELKSILDIKNKHLIPIKTQFSKQKETT